MRVISSAREYAKEIVTELIAAGVTDENETDIYHVIVGLRKLKPLAPFVGYREANTKYSKELAKWLDKGKELVAAAPENAFLEFVLSSAPFINDVESNRRPQAFGEILSSMRVQCTWLLQQKPGVHGSSGYQQERAAIIARGLMEKHSLPLAYSSPNSTYRNVARLFFEAMMGLSPENGEDIERACRVVAKRPIASGIEILAQM